MHKLDPNEYQSIRHLFDGLQHNLVVDSIIEGNTPAWVFTDQPDRPTIALMWNRQDALLLGGAPVQGVSLAPFGAVLREQIAPDARGRQIPELALHYPKEVEESEVETLLVGFRAERAARRYYHPGPLQVAWRDRVPAGYEVRRVDQALLEDENLANVREMRGWVLSFWSSVPDFLHTGFGYCVVGEGQVTSWCLSVYAAGQQRELGLATAPSQRGRGFATLTAAASVEHCAENNLVPHWHCWEENLPSIAVAEKVGFRQPVTYHVYRFAP